MLDAAVAVPVKEPLKVGAEIAPPAVLLPAVVDMLPLAVVMLPLDVVMLPPEVCMLPVPVCTYPVFVVMFPVFVLIFPDVTKLAESIVPVIFMEEDHVGTPSPALVNTWPLVPFSMNPVVFSAVW